MHFRSPLLVVTLITALVLAPGCQACAARCVTSLDNGTNNVRAVELLLACHPTDMLCCYTVDYNLPFPARLPGNASLAGCWDSAGEPVMDKFQGLVTMPANSPCYYGSDSVAAQSGQCLMALVPTDIYTFSSLNFTGSIATYDSTFNPNGASLHSWTAAGLVLLAATIAVTL